MHKHHYQPGVPSKDLPPLSTNFGSIFIRNQFLTKIPTTFTTHPDLSGKCAIITGSNTGLGFEAAKQFIALGLKHLVMGVRSLDKGHAAAQELRSDDSVKIDVWHLDMESYASIQQFASQCQHLARIDIVILNAGVSALRYATVPGTHNERTLQVNHLSTSLLALLLLPILKKKAQDDFKPRLCVVNSIMAHMSNFPQRDQRPLLQAFNDMAIAQWDPATVYGVSKLLNQLFFVRLADLVKAEHVIINMVDPGLTKGTSLSREVKGSLAVVTKIFFGVAGRTVQAGAATYLDATLMQGRNSHGSFLVNREITPLSRWYYSGGQSLLDCVWDETIGELNSLEANRIIDSII